MSKIITENGKDGNVEIDADGDLTAPTGKFGGAANYSEFESDGTLKFNGDAVLLNFDVHIECDTTGSREEYTK